MSLPRPFSVEWWERFEEEAIARMSPFTDDPLRHPLEDRAPAPPETGPAPDVVAALYAIALTARVLLDYPPESAAATFARDKLRVRLEELRELERAAPVQR